ncbi:U-scoloptoxin(18)-Er1a-like [Ixodes scapularis]|uniref:U-scoloptoxin(18)-Er1a-like n=1 Tax=Ixodes scapularis TaxID=6945 RepID=UPI001A9E0D53|nr:U-scoloptoxin(18)-Er1a-like [Ixodes scapularis]
MKTDLAALALTFVVSSLLADVISSQDQKPVLPGPFTRPTPSPGGKGEPCGPYRSCRSGLCCLLTENNDGARSTCEPKGRPGQQCSEDQVKGGTYSSLCPCLTGPCPASPNNRCLYLPNN